MRDNTNNKYVNARSICYETITDNLTETLLQRRKEERRKRRIKLRRKYFIYRISFITMLITIITICNMVSMKIFFDERNTDKIVDVPNSLNTVEEINVRLATNSDNQLIKEFNEKDDIIQSISEESSKMSEEEFQNRCRMTYAEAGLELMEGQIAVQAVIINREETPEFPDSFEEVINQSGAFSSVHDGEIYIMTYNPYVLDYEDIPDITLEATQRALEGEDPTEQLLWDEAVRLGLNPEEYAAGGALYFYNPDACSEFALRERDNIKCRVRIGNHVFYKVWG